jgi:hypothetical protein
LPKSNLNKKEIHLIELAQNAWSYAMQDLYFPPLNEPNYIFDYSNLEGFYIDPENQWQITMNLSNTPLFLEDKDYVNYFHAISLHEISHYQIIPYDGLINANLLKAAMNHVSQYFAPIVVNIFADFVIDTKLHKKNPDLISWEISQTFKQVIEKNSSKISEFSKFLFCSYELLLNINLQDDELFNEVKPLSKRVIKIVMKDFEDESKWESKVSRIAYHLKSLINNTFTLIGPNYRSEKGKARRTSGTSNKARVEFPEEILEIMDNPFDSKNRDKLKKDNNDELTMKAEEFAKSTPYSIFGAPAGQAGILIDGNPLATWYRGLAKDLIEIKILDEKPGGQLPLYPEVWRLGDPIEDLDVVQTLLNSPVIIPNITTRKWSKKEGPGHEVEEELPDLLIVIDSSGSMNWNYLSNKPKNPYHLALLASFASLHFAARKGVKFSIINFSNRAEICDWTFDYHQAEKVLLSYQGGGTVLPTKTIIKQSDRSKQKTLVFIITDFGIYNWINAKKSFIEMYDKGHKVIGFFIGSQKIPTEKFKELNNKVKLYPIKKAKDLVDLIIEEIKFNYIN